MPGRGVDEPVQSSPVIQLVKSSGRVPNVPAPAMDGRSDLLKAIRDGLQICSTSLGFIAFFKMYLNKNL